MESFLRKCVLNQRVGLALALILGTNTLFGVTLKEYLKPEHHAQIERDGGFNAPIAYSVATKFLTAKFPPETLDDKKHSVRMAVLRSIQELFKAERERAPESDCIVLKESRIYGLIKSVARGNGVDLDFSDCTDYTESMEVDEVAVKKRGLEEELGFDDEVCKKAARLDMSGAAACAKAAEVLSLTEFMPKEEVQKAKERGHYHIGQFNEAFRIFLMKNAESFDEDKIKTHKINFSEKYFPNLGRENQFAKLSEVDEGFAEYVRELGIDKIIKLNAKELEADPCLYCHEHWYESEGFVEGDCGCRLKLHKKCLKDVLATRPICLICPKFFYSCFADWVRIISSCDVLQVQQLMDLGFGVDSIDAESGRTALMVAIDSGSVEVVKLLLGMGANVNAVNPDGNTVLICAIHCGNIEIVKALLENGDKFMTASQQTGMSTEEVLVRYAVDVNIVFGRDKQTPLIWACEKGHKDLVELLVTHGADVNIVFGRGKKTPLIWACEKGHKDLVKLLVTHGADVNIVFGWDKQTPLIWACEKGHKDIVERLIEKGADVNAVNKNGNTPLIWASYYGHKDTVERLIEKGADVNAVNKNGNTPLICACAKGHKDIVERLIEKGADVNVACENGKTPLVLVCEKNNKDNNDLISLLIARGANIDMVDKDGKISPIWAYVRTYEDIFELLLSKYEDINAFSTEIADIWFKAVKEGDLQKLIKLLARRYNINILNEHGRTALIQAIVDSKVEVAELLIAHDADVNVADREGQTALILASWMGFYGVVRQLIEKSANVNAINKYGSTALISAAEQGHAEVVKLLLENGPAIVKGSTALIQAIVKGKIKVAELLIAHDADVNVADREGQTALILASWRGFYGVVRKLIEKSANVNAINEYGSTALISAAEQGHAEVVKLLLENRADTTIVKNGFTALGWAKHKKRDGLVAIFERYGIAE